MRSLLLVLLAVFFGIAHAQAHSIDGDGPTVAVLAMASEDGFSPAQQLAIAAFEEAVRARGLNRAGDRHITLFIDAVEIDGDPEGRLAVSVTVLSMLPEKIVELGAEAEAFYVAAGLAGEALPEDGVHVRRWMSADWLRQYHAIQGQHLFLAVAEALDRNAAEIVAAL